jgi:hypothetical protein
VWHAPSIFNLALTPTLVVHGFGKKVNVLATSTINSSNNFFFPLPFSYLWPFCAMVWFARVLQILVTYIGYVVLL